MRTPTRSARKYLAQEGTHRARRWVAVASAVATLAVVLLGLAPGGVGATNPPVVTATPIQHLVVIVDTGASFDHYFGTYPYAANTDGTTFSAASGTPSVNGLYTSITAGGPVGPLLTANSNQYNPQRLTRNEALTSDQNHSYTPEQKAVDNGQMDKFVQNTESIGCTALFYCPPGIVMDYYDGNTTTALWNYAQHDAMSDDTYQTTFGSASPAAVNLISGDTSGAQALDPLGSSTPGAPASSSSVTAVNPTTGLGTLYGDADPYYDDCSDGNHTTTAPVVAMTGPNIGTALNAAGVTWGWFQGGFAPTGSNSGGAVCGSTHENIAGFAVQDDIPHMDPFQYYSSTANPKHLPPTSEAAIGTNGDQANHQYDLSDFSQTLTDGNLPAVSFLEASAYQDGHPGSSDPLDEQTFLTNTINQIEQSSYWPTTAILVTDLNSEGWYDHQDPPIVNGSDDLATDTALCTQVSVGLGGANDRCGYAMRVPLLAISPYAPANTVSHVRNDTTSILGFIEENWLGSKRVDTASFDNLTGRIDGPGGLLNFSAPPHYDELVVDPTTGAVVSDSTVSPCGSLTAYFLSATSAAGNFTGLFCVNAAGTGTYTQFSPGPSATGTGKILTSGTTTGISATGTKLALFGEKTPTFNTFTETAPAPMKTGTFSLTLVS